MSSVQEPSDMKMCKLFAFIDDTYRYIRRLYLGIHTESYNTILMQTINKYKNGCNKILEEVLESYEMSKKLAQNIVRTIDIFKELCTSLTDSEEYQHRICEMMSIFIACELRLSADATIQDQILIGKRIVYIMRKHLVEEIEDDTRYNILRTLVYIPRLFNARGIMCAIISQFILIKPVSVVNVLPDKLYMLYILVFYRWMMMQKDDDDKLLIINFAESFMKPSVTLCSNQLYATHLPRYTTHSTATRTILNNMKFYRDIRNASIIDNALKKIGSIVDLCDDDEDADLVLLNTSNSIQFAEIFSFIQSNRLEDSMSNIKLEEKTVIGTVDLTTEEEESTNSLETIQKRHNKWLSNFQQLAKQFREAQIVIERQQNNHQISNNQKETIICLDSDLESDEESTAKNKTNEFAENLFGDNYRPTETPINIGADLESFDVDDDATKLSSRFLCGTLRTYQGKKVQLESQNNIDKVYQRANIHNSSTSPENPVDEYELDHENESNALASITLEESRPRVSHPTYNSIQNNNIFCSQSHTQVPYNNKGQSFQDHEQNHPQVRDSNASDIKISVKHKKEIHFNTSTIDSTYVAGSEQNSPLKTVIQRSKSKASDASKLSLNKQQQQVTEHTSHKNNKKKEDTNFEIKRKSTKINQTNKCLKNLSGFNQKYIFKHKSFKNVKINLKKLKLNCDNLVSKPNSSVSKEEILEQPLHTSLTLPNNNNLSYLNSKQTESSQLKTNFVDNTDNSDDDVIFKKPLPVINNKCVKSTKPLKIHKVLSLRAQSFRFKTENPIQTESRNNATVNEDISKVPMNSNVEKCQDNSKAYPLDELSLINLEDSNEGKLKAEMDDLSKISKLLTEEITNLTSENINFNTGVFSDCKKLEQIKKRSGIKNVRDIKVMDKEQKAVDNNTNSTNSTINSINDNSRSQKSSVFSKEVFNNNLIDELPLKCTDQESSGNIESPYKKHDVHDVTNDLENHISANAKDGNISKTSNVIENSIQAILTAHDDINSLSSLNKSKNFNGGSITNNKNRLVTQLSVAGLPPHEPSSELRNGKKTECFTKNDINFENNCSTSTTMCRFDLDYMSENTSDNPIIMPLTSLSSKECDVGKLLEDFNHKTEDIVVDSALSKNSNTFSLSVISRETLKRSRGNDGFMVAENKQKKYICGLSNDKSECKRNSSERNQSTKTPILIEYVKRHSETEYANIDKTSCCIIGNEASEQCQENMLAPEEKTNETTKHYNSATFDLPLEKNQTKVILPSNLTTGRNNKKLNKKEIAIGKKFLKVHKTKHGRKNYHEIIMKKTKKSIKQVNQPPIRENSKYAMTSRIDNLTESNRSNNSDRNSDNEIFKQIKKSVSSHQHTTLELENWKQEMHDESEPNNSKSGGVSAIFSFPKIPIISISICTTPNNKTYFKISKRGNDNNASEEVGKIKNSNENIVESNNEGTEVKIATENSNVLNADDLRNKDRPADEKMILKKNTEEEHEDYEEEYEEQETDNIEIDKFSHDSNSACSLPLKKRPTQSETNDETEDQDEIVVTNLEQPQEIAAEVVIENSDKSKQIVEDNSSSEIEHILLEKAEQNGNNAGTWKQLTPEVHHIDNSIVFNDLEDNKPSTSVACSKKLNDPSSLFKRRVNNSIRPIGQPPVQIVAPQLKDNSSSQEHRALDIQIPNAQRMLTQNTHTLPESYPATPMLSVANVEKLMDFNRFIEELLASPDVVTIIDNANACGYYAEGQAYEMERIAILEHYNIANAKGNTSVTKPLYWKKSAGDTISIFNDNDNEWISLPPSTAKQLLKLSFVLSILQQQYKVSDVRQRINIALTFLIQTSYTSKFKSNTNTSSLQQQRMQVFSRTTSDVNSSSSSHNLSQPLPSTSYCRISANIDASNLNINPNTDSSQALQNSNYTNAQHQQLEGGLMQQELNSNNSNQKWNNLMQLGNTNSGHFIEQIITTNNTAHHITTNNENDQQHHVQQDKRNNSWDELNNDQLYINPPCATSPQNEVIVNTNGVQLHEMPQNCQDQQNIFISITDETGPTVTGNSEAAHKYNTRQQQQQQHRALDKLEQMNSSSSSPSLQSYVNRQHIGNRPGSSLIHNNLTNINHNNIVSVFSSQEITLQNPYRVQQNPQQQQLQQLQTNQLLNATISNASRQQQGNTASQNLSININKNARPYNPLTQQETQQQQYMPTKHIASTFNSQQHATTEIQNNHNKINDSNYKKILQPYITYLIKDHEKTSKHLLQVFEEVSNSNTPTTSNLNVSDNFTIHQQQQQFDSRLPTLIRNPQQNHMPGLHQVPGERSISTVLPSLIRNPNHTLNITATDSGALQVVQSFIDQSQPNNINNNFNTTNKHHQQQPQPPETTSSTLIRPGFAKEYVNFIGSRDEVLEKQKLHNFNGEEQKEKHPKHQQLQQQQQQEQVMQKKEILNSAKRKCQERNDKLAENLKRKIMELSQLKHNVQLKLSEKQQQEEQEHKKQENITGPPKKNKKRGRPKKNLVFRTCNEISVADSYAPVETNSLIKTNNSSYNETSSSIKGKQQRQTKTSKRIKRKEVNNLSPSGSSTTDHAYFRQRTAAREAAKRINAVVNNCFQ